MRAGMCPCCLLPIIRTNVRSDCQLRFRPGNAAVSTTRFRQCSQSVSFVLRLIVWSDEVCRRDTMPANNRSQQQKPQAAHDPVTVTQHARVRTQSYTVGARSTPTRPQRPSRIRYPRPSTHWSHRTALSPQKTRTRQTRHQTRAAASYTLEPATAVHRTWCPLVAAASSHPRHVRITAPRC